MANNILKKPKGLTADLGISNVNRKPTGPKDVMGYGSRGSMGRMEAGAELADIELGKKATGTVRAGIRKEKGQPASKKVGGRVDFTIDPKKYLDSVGLNIDAYLGKGQPVSLDLETLLFNKKLKIRAGAEVTPGRKPDFGIGAELRIPLGK